MPSISTFGFSSSRIIDSVFWSWTRPRIDRYSHWTGTITLLAAVKALTVRSPSDGRRVDADEVVVLGDRLQRLLERALPPDLRAHRDLGAGQVDRGAGDVDLALADHVADRMMVHEHVVHRLLDRVGVDALAHGEIALRVHVDRQHPVPRLGECDGEVERGRRLGDAALLVGEGDHLGLLAAARVGGRLARWRDARACGLVVGRRCLAAAWSAGRVRAGVAVEPCCRRLRLVGEPESLE